MTIFVLMAVLFIIGYAAIALEHPLKINKAATAVFMGMVLWVILAYFNQQIFTLNFSPSFEHIKMIGNDVANFIKNNVDAENFRKTWEHWITMATPSAEHNGHMEFVLHDLGEHLIDIAQIVFFLLGAMTIVETVDKYDGFKVITDSIKTSNPVKLVWIISFITFFLSAILDNLTTTIVMLALLRKIIDDKQMKWFFASVIVIAANAGGAWSPIGDVTTIMLWINGNVTTFKIIVGVIFPSLINLIIPLIIVSFMLKNKQINRPIVNGDEENEFTSKRERILIFTLGVGGLISVPILKTITHLPPYILMLLVLGTIWIATEIILRRKEHLDRRHLSVVKILQNVDVPTIFFFLGILLAVAALQSAGHLNLLAQWLDKTTNGNIYIIDTAIGILSSIVDNVPLVASAMGMYPIADVGHFAVDGLFWELLAYTAGTGGSILIIGSAAGVAAMGIEKIDFIWYFKKMSWLALIGYFAGVLAYYIQQSFLHTLA